MPTSGIRQIREMFLAELPQGWSILEARMDYLHDTGGEWQVLTFRAIDPDGQVHELMSQKVLARLDVAELTRNTARTLREGLKHEPSVGDSTAHGGERPAAVSENPGGDSGAIPRPTGSDETGPH